MEFIQRNEKEEYTHLHIKSTESLNTQYFHFFCLTFTNFPFIYKTAFFKFKNPSEKEHEH